MAGSYDGSIRIDTAINAAPIDNGLAQIENKIKGLAATIGLAFGVKELIDFGKRSIDAASDLAEAQNVVDTAFDSMSWKMEQFAATALETYGISELTAKNMGSTYMAMAKGMGVATDAASDMAVTLTGRLSDIMSFYNKTQSEVDTIGRALITGETEPLKAIGVVMTQTNLSAYAMAQGFAKTYDEMSSNEQLLVRYKYFLEQTSLAQGDFAKTSEGWANQTRLLSERLNEFTTNLGGVIMNVLTPALQFANEAVTFLNDLFFGGKTEEETTAAKNAEAVTDEITAVGTAADKSKKKLNNLLSGFDELHIISGAKSDDEESADAGIDTSNLLGVNLDADTSTAKKAAQKYRDIINEIYLAFKRHPLTKTIEGIIDSIGKFFGFIKGNKDISAGDIVDALMDILGAIIAYKTITGVVSGVKAFSGAFGSLIGLITAHPVIAAVAGITALTIGIIALSEEMERQRIASHFGDISISLEEIGELVNPITANVDKVAGAFEDNKTKLTTAKENFSEIAKAVQETADSFKNNNIDQDVEGFATQLDELVNSALEVNSATFDTSAIKSAFAMDGTINEEEQAILDQLGELGGSVAEKIKKYGEDIHKITDAAIKENRDLTTAEIENLESLYQKLADMTTQQENIKTAATWERLKNGAYSFDSYAEIAEQIKEAQEQAEISREAIEQSSYEALMEMIASAKETGKSDEELEKLLNDGIKKIKEDIEASRIEDKRYERDVILAWTQGAFTNMAESFATDPEELRKMQDVFELLIKTPEGVDINSLLTDAVTDNYGNTSDGYKRSQTPALGAVICWSKGVVGNEADGAGHVAIVEQILSNGDIVTSNSAYGGSRFYMQTYKKSDGYSFGAYKFQGFILPPVQIKNVTSAAANAPALAFKVGDIVEFTGSTHYTSSTGIRGTACKPGKAKITRIADGAAHPIHLVNDGSGSTVYGWVNSADVQHVTKKTVDEIAREVIRGDWGNGDERKKRLTEAGYNYDEVQARVDKLKK